MYNTIPGFYVGSEHQNSGPYVFEAKIYQLSHFPSPGIRCHSDPEGNELLLHSSSSQGCSLTRMSVSLENLVEMQVLSYFSKSTETAISIYLRS